METRLLLVYVDVSIYKKLTKLIFNIFCSSGKEDIKKEIDTSLHMCSKA